MKWQRLTGILVAVWFPCAALSAESGLLKALQLQVVYDGDVWANIDGGRDTGSIYVAHLDLSLAADAESLWNWPATRLYFRGFADSGASISNRVGDIHGVNNWEAGYRGAKLLEAWIERSFNHEQSSLRFGLYDTTTEFDKNKSEVLFINNAQGMNRPLSLSGLNGPSTYSATSLGLRLRHNLDAHWTLKAGLLEGLPGDPNDPSAFAVGIRSADGALALGEVRYHDPGGHRLALGYWRYTASFDRLTASSPARATGNQGFYVSGDTMLISAADDPLRGISVGLRLAHADADFNRFDWFASGVITDSGFLSRRPSDKIGLGFVYSRTGDGYRRHVQAQGTVVNSGELALEATYRAPITNWLTLQPDLQYIIQPANAPTSPNAVVVGLRMEIVWNR